MNPETIVREQLLALLRGGNAHMGLENAVAEFPMAHINLKPPEVPYTFWHLLEHIRLAQWDILDFIRNPNYKTVPWPEGYWPDSDALADPSDWDNTIALIKADRSALEDLVLDPDTDLYSDLPHASGYTILREILLVADHNAYHIGEFAILRQFTQTWPESRKP